jgi:hypothetical protein
MPVGALDATFSRDPMVSDSASYLLFAAAKTKAAEHRSGRFSEIAKTQADIAIRRSLGALRFL